MGDITFREVKSPVVDLIYVYRAVQNKKFARIVTYPFIDLFRTLSFCSGQVYQLFKRTRNVTEC